MKGAKAVIIAGVVIMIMGVVFHFQGQSMIGPQSSFMYSNPEWVTYGIQIAVLGGIVLAVGISFGLIKRD
jgi:hypothetical protein